MTSRNKNKLLYAFKIPSCTLDIYLHLRSVLQSSRWRPLCFSYPRLMIYNWAFIARTGHANQCFLWALVLSLVNVRVHGNAVSPPTHRSKHSFLEFKFHTGSVIWGIYKEYREGAIAFDWTSCKKYECSVLPLLDNFNFDLMCPSVTGKTLLKYLLAKIFVD